MQYRPVLTDRQTQAWLALDTPLDTIDVCYGGAKGGGKSWFLCVWMYSWVLAIADKFNLQPTDKPLHVGWMGRKQATDFTGTTLQTWQKTIPPDEYEIRSSTEKHPKHILIQGRIAIDFGGLDKQENINKFNSAEYAIIAVDQAEETTRDDVSVLMGSRRLTIDGKPLKYKGLWTANPAQCWLKDEFLNSTTPEKRFIQALPADNPYLPQSYVKTLTDAFGYRPELLDAYLHGNWASVEGAAQVILDKWIVAAALHPNTIKGKIIACDPARFGDDSTVMLVMDGSEILERKAMPYNRTTQASSALNELSRRHNDCSIVVDVIGVGGGVVDELYEMGRNVISFNGSNASDIKDQHGRDKYYNLRAEAWWMAAELYAKGNINSKGMYPDLRSQLCIPRYDFRNGKIIIEPKDEIKARLGRSPDDADCYVMGLWACKTYSGSLKHQLPAMSGSFRHTETTYLYNPWDY